MRFLKAERGERFVAGKCATGKRLVATPDCRSQFVCIRIDLIDVYWLKIANNIDLIEWIISLMAGFVPVPRSVESEMIELRPYARLGHAQHGWLNARHHFSFAGYHDVERMRWGRLRVWNDDSIAPQSGFEPHSHRDMEIITYVRQGAITHEDSLGNRGRTVAGDVQVMSAGTGIVHSEYNLEDVETRIFQIWIHPQQTGLPPAWGTRQFPTGERAGAFVTLASGLSGDDEALPIRAEARLAAATLAAGQSADYEIAAGHRVYLVPASGQIEINGLAVAAGDGVAVRDETRLSIRAVADSEVVLVESL